MATTFRHILCPVDFSDCSRHALDHAVAVARSYGGAVTVMHTLQTVVYGADPMLMSAAVPTPEDYDRIRQDLETFSRHEAGGLSIETHLSEGSPVPAILEKAAALPADLLVLGTHGRRGFERFLLGSTTERLLRRATCPVLTVPPRVPDAAPVGPVAFSRILCAIDFSKASLAALQYAASLARETGAHLTLLTVVEPMPVPDAMTMVGGGIDDIEEVACAAMRARLHSIAPQDVTAAEVVMSGKPYKLILERARTDRADLIVIGVHGGPAALPGFLGSTTNHVVREADCPVLSLRG